MTLSAEGLAQLQSEITRKKTERQRAEEDGVRDYNLLANGLIQRIRAEMLEIVTALAKERGLDLVLDSPAAVYFSPAIDVTDDVVKRYDASKAVKK